MLEVSALECVRGERRLFADVGFRVDAGQLLHVQGGNGCGKTSLLRIVCALSPAAAGEVRWRGKPIARLGEDYRRELFYLGHHNAIKDELSPLENLLAGAHIADEALGEDDAFAALAAVGLGSRADLPCRYLSQGQKRRVALSRLWHDQRALWVLDEPYVALDAQAIALVAARIGNHLARGGLALLTTHQPVAIAGADVAELRLD